jgi:hypothetical protein
MIIKCPDHPSTVEALRAPSVFLAGSCSTNWRDRFSLAGVTVFNPVSDLPLEQRTIWEWEYLIMSSMVVMWLSGTECPISLYELGRYVHSSNKPCIVGMSPDYIKKDEVVMLCKINRPDMMVFESDEYEAIKIFTDWIYKGIRQ